MAIKQQDPRNSRLGNANIVKSSETQESDSFVLNDIALTIPPTDIHIEKIAYNHEWHTLRTSSPHKSKSGYSLCRVSLNVVFNGADEINNKLRPLVAGLRATPFCVVYNDYLNNSLITSDSTGEINTHKSFGKYKKFQPVALALNAMSFHTGGQLGTPGAIYARFEFVWFNYFPYTPILAFKKNDGTAGYPWESDLWKAFYQPKLNETFPVNFSDWPHGFNSLEGLTFSYREFTSVAIDQRDIDEEEVLKNRPKSVFDGLQRNTLEGEGITADSITTEGALTALANNLGPDFANQIRDKINSVTSGINSGLSNLVKRVAGEDFHSQIEQSVRRYDTKIKQQEEARQTAEDKINAGFEIMHKLSVNASQRSNKEEFVGGKTLLQRMRNYTFHPLTDGSIVEHVSINFSNILAMIPMVGYRYPTIQHTGSIDTDITITINTRNDTVGRIQYEWDLIENMALKYKQVPVHLTTVRVDNDFLRLFGIKEFITKSISTDTINGQPGRSQVVLNLTQSSVNDQSKLLDPDANELDDGREEFQQEFIRSDVDLNIKIWDVLKNHLRQERDKNGQEKYDVRYYYMERVKVHNDGREVAFKKLVDEARDNYNRFAQQVHNTLFTRREKEWISAFFSVGKTEDERDKTFGFIPHIFTLRAGIRERLNSEPGLTKFIRQADESNFPGGDERTRILQELGLETYLRNQKALFDKIVDRYIELEQFEHLKEIVDNLGLGKGVMAYADFKPQIKSMVQFATGTRNVSDSSLLDYDPDSYFWYPLLDGSNASDLNINNYIDPYIVNQAIRHSTAIYDEAQGSNSEFFTKTYRDLLQNENITGPLKRLQELTGGDSDIQLAEPFYSESNNNVSTWQNTLSDPKTKSALGGISKKIIPDSKGKSHTNFYGENTNLSTDNTISCTTKISELWSSDPASLDTLSALPSTPPSSKPSTPNTDEGNTYTGNKSLNSKWDKLDELRPQWFRDKISRILDRLEQQGFKPRIAAGYRSPRETEEKRRKGHTKLPPGKPSFHTYGLACDIIDRRVAWPRKNDPQYSQKLELAVSFWKALRTECNKEGLRSGGDWPRTNPVYARFGLGWDPAHIQAYRYRSEIPAELKTDARAPGSELLTRKASTNTGVANTLASPLQRAVLESTKEMLSGQAQSMMRAYPAFKLYFIEDDSGERKRLAFDDFFSYNAVQSIRVVSNKNIPCDFCELRLTNLSGILSNRKFKNTRNPNAPRNKSGEIVEESTQAMLEGTTKENPFASLLLQEGIIIHVKLGYSNDPEKLDTVFTGPITAIQFSENEDLVIIQAQSFALELIQDVKGIEKPTTKTRGWNWWGFKDDASTGRILEEMMAEPEVLHFGRWRPNTGGATPYRNLLVNKYEFEPTPQDDNIFAPPATEDIKNFGTNDPLVTDVTNLTGFLFKKISYTIYRTTIWDIFKEMECRYPNMIAWPRYYKDKFGERMTMFFGLPNQLYFSREPTGPEKNVQDRMKQTQENFIKKSGELALRESGAFNTGLTGSIRNASRTLQDQSLRNSLETIQKNNIKIKSIQQERLDEARAAGFIKPFRDYHLITSAHHIISNDIKTNSRDVANTIVVKYAKDVEDLVEDDNVSLKGTEEEFTLKLDNALPTEEIRTKYAQYLNVHTDEAAKRYALTELIRELKEIYQGDITVIGNGKIKVYDVTYILDEYTDITGAVEVGQVEHIFDQQHGFRTVIKPDMLVQASEWSLLSSCEGMGIIMEGLARDVFGKDSMFHNLGTGSGWSPFPNLIGGTFDFFGGFLAQKIVNYNQLGQPVIMSPLLHHGRIFTGGVPTRKIPTSIWTTMFGIWKPVTNSKSSFYRWWEDWTDEVSYSIKRNIGIQQREE